MNESVDKFLQRVKPRKVFVPRLPGNNGDRLMVLGLWETLRKHHIQRSCIGNQGDWILLHGSGAMNDFWRCALDCFQQVLEEYPEQPLAVMPSSFHFVKTDFQAVLAARKAPCVLFAREKNSYDLLCSMTFPEAVSISLDDDIALALEESRMVERYRKLRNDKPGDYILIVDRSDLESPFISDPLVTERKPFFMDTWLTGPAKAILRPLRQAKAQTQASLRRRKSPPQIRPQFKQECEALIRTREPALSGLPWIIGDVSDPYEFSFDRFCRLIAQARLVITTRLHAAVFSALVGTPCYGRAGRYGKIRGVYEQSLKRYRNVKLFTEEGKILGG